MRTKPRKAVLIAAMIFASPVVFGSTAVTPNIHHDVQVPITAAQSATTPDATPDYYHDI